MSALKKVTLVLAMLLAGVLVFAATRLNSFHVERTTSIAASPEVILSLLTNFRRWRVWSPWEDLDPQLKRAFVGPRNGPGAIYQWSGNSDVGAGRMQVLSVTPTAVTIELEFLAPMQSVSTTAFVLEPRATSEPGGIATRVVWSLDGPMPYLSKLFSVFASMDGLVGKDFETGLARLKIAAEKAALRAALAAPESVSASSEVNVPEGSEDDGPCDKEEEERYVSYMRDCKARPVRAEKYWTNFETAQSEVMVMLQQGDLSGVAGYFGCHASDLSMNELLCEGDQGIATAQVLEPFTKAFANNQNILDQAEWRVPEYPDVGSSYRILCSPAGPFRAAKNHCDSNDAFQPLIELNEVDGKIYISGVPMSGVWPGESTVTAPAASSADQD